MQKPAEVKQGRLYIYGIRVPVPDGYARAYAEDINAAAAAYRERAVLAIKAGGCA